MKAKMSIGTPVTQIPGVMRKHTLTRVKQVQKALNKVQSGQVLPVYTGSLASAGSLATLLRKAFKKDATVAVRKHIVYVQRRNDQAETAAPVLPNQDVISSIAGTGL